MGEFDDIEEEEQPVRKRPRTMGLRKALEKQREEEAALARSYPLTQLLAQEIENDKESWLERANKNLEDKLKKAKQRLGFAKEDDQALQEIESICPKKTQNCSRKAQNCPKEVPSEKRGKIHI